MAVTKTKVVNGLTGNFWKARRVNIAPDNSTAQAVLNLFTSQAAYLSGSTPIWATDVELTNGDQPLTALAIENILEQKLTLLAGELNGGTYVSGI